MELQPAILLDMNKELIPFEILKETDDLSR